jgi:hypothetical protein
MICDDDDDYDLILPAKPGTGNSLETFADFGYKYFKEVSVHIKSLIK